MNGTQALQLQKQKSAPAASDIPQATGNWSRHENLGGGWDQSGGTQFLPPTPTQPCPEPGLPSRRPPSCRASPTAPARGAGRRGSSQALSPCLWGKPAPHSCVGRDPLPAPRPATAQGNGGRLRAPTSLWRRDPHLVTAPSRRAAAQPSSAPPLPEPQPPPLPPPPEPGRPSHSPAATAGSLQARKRPPPPAPRPGRVTRRPANQSAASAVSVTAAGQRLQSDAEKRPASGRGWPLRDVDNDQPPDRNYVIVGGRGRSPMGAGHVWTLKGAARAWLEASRGAWVCQESKGARVP